jgi:hypothetical protein
MIRNGKLVPWKDMTRAERRAETARITAYLVKREAEDRAAERARGYIRPEPVHASSLCVHGHPLGRGHECPGCIELARQYAGRSSQVRAIERAAAHPMATA